MDVINRAAKTLCRSASHPANISKHPASGVTWGQGASPRSALHVFTETIDVNSRDVAGKVTALQLKPWQTIKDVKRSLAQESAPKGLGLLVDEGALVSEEKRQRLFFLGEALKDAKTVKDYKLKSGDTVHQKSETEKPSPPLKPGTKEWLMAAPDTPNPEIKVEVVMGSSKCPPELLSCIEETRRGLESGMVPQLARSGLGGTYFLSNSESKVLGVFKPEDEEAYAPNNPRELKGRMGSRGVRGGLRSGEANVREVAAYLLDHEKFANVPATVRVEISHASFGEVPKIGSFQEFKPHDEEAGDVSPSLFSVEAAHRVAIMDIRLLNTDRNDENLLVKKSGSDGCELIPIDHGCSLPDSLEVNWYDWAWLSWPQSKEPLSASEKEYIARLDAEQDVNLLSRELLMRWQCLLVLRVATTFLQLGAAADLSLFDIADMMCRDDVDKLSVLEIVFAQAKTLAETKQADRGVSRRRSPPLSPTSTPPGQMKIGKKMRRSASATSLSLDSFKLPGASAPSSGMGPCDDVGAWALEDCSQELFDEDFWTDLKDLMTGAVQRRMMKRMALQSLKQSSGAA